MDPRTRRRKSPHGAAGIDEEVEQRAMEAQVQLARAEHHRMAPIDLLLAALAHRHEQGILQYDREYDVLAPRTDLRSAARGLRLLGRSHLTPEPPDQKLPRPF
jgi:hypothetical protein